MRGATKIGYFRTGLGLIVCVPVGLLLFAAGCKNPQAEERTYFSTRIAPILNENCVNGTADNKCHVEVKTIDEQGNEVASGEAMGNLDLSSFEAVRLRPELLESYGSFPDPVMLIKAVKPSEVSIRYGTESHESEIFHGGGGILTRDSEAFIELQTWLKNGATEDGFPPEDSVQSGVGDCATALRPDVEPFLDQATGAGYDQFKSEVHGILRDGCAAGTCHGSPQSDFYVTCGNNEEQLRHDYVIARSFVADAGARSELLLRPLSPNSGGTSHSGGYEWGSADDKDYKKVLAWADSVGPLDPGDESPGYTFFSEQVMPVLLRRGCAMPQCHSPHGFNDFRLRAGSLGFFSPLAVARNYDETISDFVNLDTPDATESRIIKKNIARKRDGTEHRAGVLLLEPRDDGGDASLCEAQKQSPEGMSSFCILVEWVRIEREAAVNAGIVAPMAEGDTVPIIYVDRPPNPDRAIDFANFRGDARLMRLDATLGPEGHMAAFGAPTEIDLSGCASFSPDQLDVRAPEVSYEGDRLTFALRAGQDDGLNVYVSNLDGSNCQKLTTDGGQTDSQVPIHNFDPVFIPPDPKLNPGGSIVFASTRPAAPWNRSIVSPRYKLPASNLWRMKLDGSGLEQMTFLNGSELSPGMMRSGKVTMTTEKATEGFYQLSGRRINWDLTDYHPLLAQRESIGFRQATEVREALDGDFWFILSDPGSWFMGGTLTVLNRSIGPFEYGRDDPSFLHSIEFLDPANELAGAAPAQGAYRSPFTAPDGQVLVSYAAGNLDLRDKAAAVDYDLVVFDRVTNTRVMVAGGGDGRFQVEGIVAYQRSSRRVYYNKPHLVFGGGVIPEAKAAGQAWAHILDGPMIFSLLTDNLRRGRNLDALDSGDTFAAYLAHPPPVGATDDGTTHQDWELVGTVGLEDDGSAFFTGPAAVPIIMELRDGDDSVLLMNEEHQFGPGEMTSLGVSREFFDGVCGGCHGSVSGRELEVVVDEDALTGASTSIARPDTQAKPSKSL